MRKAVGANLFVDWGQYDKTVFFLLNEAVKAFVFELVISYLLSDWSQVEAQGWVTDMHHKADLCYARHKQSNYLSCSRFPVLNRKGLLKIKSDWLCKLQVMALLLNLPPIWLVGLFKHRIHWSVWQSLNASYLLQYQLGWQKVFLDGAHYFRKNVSVEIDYAIQVEFRGKNIEEDVLAVAFVQLLYLGDQLVKHGERLAGVALAWHHLPHTWLQHEYFVLQFFVLSF